MTSRGSFPLRVSTTTPNDWRDCLIASDRVSSSWIISVAFRAAVWYSMAASAADSASPVSMASMVARAAFAAALAASAAALAAASACELRPFRRRTRVGLRPSPLQKASTSTPSGRFGSSLVSGRFSRSVASSTRIRSTPFGSSRPKVDSHLRPFSRDRTVLFSTIGPLLPSLGKVAITASTWEYHGMMTFPPFDRLEADESPKKASMSSPSSSSSSMSRPGKVFPSMLASSASSAQMCSGGGAIS
mmetsp:Transcript_25192/g.59021  ORF Transcript_25192/g.59021 Transcript_25192/m.59021 type:complete len:246 (-) Transcript_25192:1070-1807(-)